MNYFFEGAFKDKDHWKKILIVVTIFAAVAVKIVEGISGQPIFGGYLFNGVIILGTISLIVTAVKGTIAEKSNKKITIDQELFERNMRTKIRKIIIDKPDFQTFCFQCSHYNEDKRNGC